MAGTDLATSVYRHSLARVRAQVIRDVLALARTVDVEDVDRWWRATSPQVAGQVRKGWLSARDLAVRYLKQHSTAAGVELGEVATADLDTGSAATALRVTGPVAFKTAVRRGANTARAVTTMAVRLSGAASRVAVNGARDTVQANIADSLRILGWRRVGDGHSCYWCAMLISRGAVYGSPAKAGAGQHWHDFDGCTQEPLYEVEDDPQHVLDLQQQWRDVTAGKSGKAAVAAWRQHWEGKGA